MACYVVTHTHWLSITEHKDTLNCSLKITISWPLITWIIPATAGFFPVTCQRTRLIIRGWINITNWEKQTLFSSLRMDGINQPCRTRSLSFCGTNTTGRDSVWCDINTMKCRAYIWCIPVIFTTTYVSGLRTFSSSFCTHGTDVCHIYMRLDIYLKVLEFLRFGCITLPVYSGRILHTNVWYYFRLDTRQFNLMLSPSPPESKLFIRDHQAIYSVDHDEFLLRINI